MGHNRACNGITLPLPFNLSMSADVKLVVSATTRHLYVHLVCSGHIEHSY